MPDLVPGPAVRDALQEAVAEVLEKMFFIRILDAPAGTGPGRAGWSGDSDMAAQVRFHGEPSGRLSLRLDSRTARGIAADFLGEEEAELSDDEVEAVLRELANMVCGTVLSRVESATLFQLDEPVMAGSEATSAGEAETAAHVFPIGGGELTVKIWMETAPCCLAEESAS